MNRTGARYGRASAGEVERVQRAPGKRTLTQRLPAKTSATPRTGQDPPLDHLTLFGVRLDASSGAKQFAALDRELTSRGLLDEFRDGLKTDPLPILAQLDAVEPQLEVDDLPFLETLAANYAAWVAIPDVDKPAALVRDELTIVGYTEKDKYQQGEARKELTSGGAIQPALADLIVKVFDAVHAALGDEVKIKISGGNDQFHQDHTRGGDCHTEGRAVDITVTPSSKKDEVLAILQSLGVPDLRGAWNNDKLGYLDEYSSLSAIGTAPHIHIQVAP